jgi:phytoene synthase
MTVDYEPSRKLCEQHATSFYAVAQFLPEETKNAAYAMYGFCRYTDNIVDGDGSLEYKKKHLRLWKHALHSQWEKPNPQHAILHAFVETCKEYRIPPEMGFGLIEGLEKDLHTNTYADYDALYAYCYAAGGIPGLFMARLAHAPPSTYAAAVSLGVGMQLTNILRDIGEDLERGRMYLPQDEMKEYGYSPEMLHRHVRDKHFRDFMAFQVERAQSYYDEAEKALPLVEASTRLSLELCLAYYREILHVMEEHGYDVFSGRVFVSEERKRGLLGETIAKLLPAQPLKDPVHE